MLLHDLENLLINILMPFDLGHLETAGAQECGRGSLQQLNPGLIVQILAQIDQIVLQESFDSVYHTINFLYAKLLGSRIYAGNGRVDDSGRSAGLSHYNVSSHFDISFWCVKNRNPCRSACADGSIPGKSALFPKPLRL